MGCSEFVIQLSIETARGDGLMCTTYITITTTSRNVHNIVTAMVTAAVGLVDGDRVPSRTSRIRL